MKFLLMLTWAADWDRLAPTEQQHVMETHARVTAELAGQGKLVESVGLRHPSEAVTLRHPGGRAVVLEGPFTETREPLGGFYVIQAASRDEAVEWAKKLPVVGDGGVE